ncbi:arylamine N-acetyltransferase family protein [Thaumasiovibrio subtropicus]|uniref:arylamine N-acetyltransferase family protein n=1 Tax=Thaumasiovibrio subtropicus TaxID=1891207 RepID=UPI00131E0238|nr:arylamine N-acetyltransferase [Thaumasiovibrio subtropicus]
MNIDDFLDRIQYQGDTVVNLACLTELQWRFLNSVPFENLDIMAGVPLDFSVENVFAKIVVNHRGGVCFENNSLFCWVLSEIGFDVQLIAAEMFPGETFRNHFDHMALLVNLEGKTYLVDVGNGKYFGPPLDIDSPNEAVGEGVRYKIAPYAMNDLALCFFNEGKWQYRYAFQRQPVGLADFKQVCTFIETSSESSFTQKVLVTRLDGDKRITLSGNKLVITGEGEQPEERNVTAEQPAVLLENFGIKIE